MRKLISISILALMLNSCESVVGQPEGHYDIITIDGCQYLKRYNGYQEGHSFTHKGDCNNPIHKTIIHDTIYINK